MPNSHMFRAKMVPDDEFYTRTEDIHKELKHYYKLFRDKIIYCNCDNPKYSQFIKYFNDNKHDIGHKDLLYSHLEDEDFLPDGDFRSPKSIAKLKQADIVITNPPFSMFRKYYKFLRKHEKKFLIVGPLLCGQYQELLPDIMKVKIWTGHNRLSIFDKPNNGIGKAACVWITNLPARRNRRLVLTKKYCGNEDKYPVYDNYSGAINVDRLTDIPCDYYGEMGVPMTVYDSYDPQQFKIIGGTMDTLKPPEGFVNCFTPAVDSAGRRHTAPILNGKIKFSRIIIKRKR